ncbi:MAG: hypothetical protein A2729_04645 [Candidatus Buchananbacteria bacterium RIFCSPHIGHO2_01_FULL_39_14]|uniref:PEP-utilising enzyme mobile domain-containing protein n=1 Tax=Candidatus Buchananbacteria bacterium RIFCSPHIGHO2_01_FULL_39_14 TaxID=1797532 RepID=A0A1G1XV06_9BACT|nr:MAG: hypothetical protein A2729_04645 [Candidatus Buchananbacteria bacterium RIFCSPHIGHO2_01_FULL_39_14]OGY49248.1 MAG: hypothetical protein A3D39_03060 [Candidatus Buchananbacteria bacterium RIFCSPHIGHO2_02_FULL_39_17]
MKINIDPKAELFEWGPIDGKLIYTDYFNVAFTEYANKVFISWPDILWIGLKEKVTCIIDYAELRKSGERNFKAFILNDKKFKNNFIWWQKAVKSLLTFQKNISQKSLKKMSQEQLADCYDQWAKLFLDFWTIGELPELAGWGGEVILKKALEKSVPEKYLSTAFEKLFALEELSFYQKSELDLLKIGKFLNNKSVLENQLENYQKNHFWILNSYYHTKILNKNYFKNELLNYSPKLRKEKIEELSDLPKKAMKEKNRIAKIFQLDKKTLKIAKRLSFCMWWQDSRKFYIFLANYYIDLFLKEFSSRFKINFDDLHYYNCYEILDLAKKGKKIPTTEIKKRYNNLVVYYSKNYNSLKYVFGKEAAAVTSKFLNVKVDKNIAELKGVVVSRGRTIKAIVKILTSPSQADKLKEGEILVAPMTSPDYILAIKKASAIITDVGGMTSHAAVVSRELGIPCIAGTKIATKVLKDGDLVEVNTNNGIIKKLK